MEQRSEVGTEHATSDDGTRNIVDAHQHFWDPATHYYPWLNDEPPIRFRYGDYRAIRRRYLPPDYRADAAPFNVVKISVRRSGVGSADPIGEMRYIDRLRREHGLPTVAVAQAWLDRDDAPAVARAAGGVHVRPQRAPQAARQRESRATARPAE